MLLLAGNAQALRSKDHELVLDQLRLNRQRYKERAAAQAATAGQRQSFDVFESASYERGGVSDEPRALGSPLLSSHLMEEQAVLDSIFFDEESAPASLTVLFSAPLAWRDRANRLFPIETLDHAAEREALVQVFR